jgi:hypothetical protein
MVSEAGLKIVLLRASFENGWPVMNRRTRGRHTRESGYPGEVMGKQAWIPASAGMTN